MNVYLGFSVGATEAKRSVMGTIQLGINVVGEIKLASSLNPFPKK